jgi:subtilisin family serine protease
MSNSHTPFVRFAMPLAFVLSLNSFTAGAVSLESQQRYVTGEVLVKFKPSVSAVVREAAVSAGGGAVQATLERGLTHIKLPAGQSVEATVAAYSSNSNVEYAQPNYIYREMAVPTAPSYGQQWGFKNTGQIVNGSAGTLGKDMNLEPAWNHITDCSSVVVAVVDSGVNYNHEDLIGNMWNGTAAGYLNHGYNYTNEGAVDDPMDKTGHGTHVAGIIGANSLGVTGVTGVCWKANIMAVRVLDATGAGTTVTISQGINFAVSNGAKVINMSVGGVTTADTTLSTALTSAQNNDVVVVVAAGNSGLNHSISANADYPCDFTQPNLVCVAALDQNGALATFSDYGLTSVDVGAPGVNIYSSVAGTWSGNIIAPMSWSATTTTTGGFAGGTVTPNITPPLVLPNAGGSSYFSMNNPGTWGSAYTYNANTDDRMWTQIDFSAYSAVKADFFYAAHVANATATTANAALGTVDMNSGHYAVAYSAVAGDPFGVASPKYLIGPFYTDGITPSTTPDFWKRNTVSLTNCLTTTCSIGFRLKTGTLLDMGLSLVEFTYNGFTRSDTAYILKDGTSMATPAVAGVAAMLRAYNPQYTYTDVVASIKNAGRSTSSLVGKTSTGNAVDAMKSLAYINAPKGLIATVH